MIFIKIVSNRNKKYFKQYRFYSSERLNGNFTVIGKVIDGWDEIERLEHVEVEEAIEPQSGFVYHRPVKTEMITKVRCIK